MPLDAKFYEAIEPLFEPGFGTEHAGPLLYSLVRMTRPRRVLEVGLGYTTPFLVQALADSRAEDAADRDIMRDRPDNDPRKSTLSRRWYATGYAPRHYAIDDFSTAGQTADRVLEIVRSLGLADFMEMHEGDFRGRARELPHDARPFDLVWFDCGGPPEYIDFLNEYWPLINPDHGLLLLHSTYWNLQTTWHGREVSNLICGSIANEIKRQQMVAGLDARFEVLSLVEPHKIRQGSITLVRRLAPASMCRGNDFREEMFEIFGAGPTAIRRL